MAETPAAWPAVGTAGFEPATSATRTLRATKLRYVPCTAPACEPLEQSTGCGRRSVPGPLASIPVVRIAQVAPPWLAVPPKGYGGIEWVVALLTDGLVERGHDVTLFATGDSTTKGRLDYVVERAPGPRFINDGL